MSDSLNVKEITASVDGKKVSFREYVREGTAVDPD